jgi:hypothetical protein
MNILKFKEFEHTQHKLYIFDFDDTLVKTPNFEDLALEFLNESNVLELLKKSVNSINVDLKDLKWENGRIYLDDPELKIKISNNWIRKGKRIYLTTPHKFSYLEESMPTILKETSDLYKSVVNKCIVTARPEGSRKLLEKTLIKLGLDFPKYGIHMRPDGMINAGGWKGFQILDIVKKNGFSSVAFYDDNPKYIKRVKKFIEENAPELNFEYFKVK